MRVLLHGLVLILSLMLTSLLFSCRRSEPESAIAPLVQAIETQDKVLWAASFDHRAGKNVQAEAHTFKKYSAIYKSLKARESSASLTLGRRWIVDDELSEDTSTQDGFIKGYVTRVYELPVMNGEQVVLKLEIACMREYVRPLHSFIPSFTQIGKLVGKAGSAWGVNNTEVSCKVRQIID